ncbi:uncharacterized protein IWZ02DRAFT_514365 [Phyllosticta citriasiana]|uniref:uncharacterized protein n=1 Tax=Phyllosticta citriasiana TaxID=595635 RepID=UPI0030FD2A73
MAPKRSADSDLSCGLPWKCLNQTLTNDLGSGHSALDDDEQDFLKTFLRTSGNNGQRKFKEVNVATQVNKDLSLTPEFDNPKIRLVARFSYEAQFYNFGDEGVFAIPEGGYRDIEPELNLLAVLRPSYLAGPETGVPLALPVYDGLPEKQAQPISTTFNGLTQGPYTEDSHNERRRPEYNQTSEQRAQLLEPHLQPPRAPLVKPAQFHEPQPSPQTIEDPTPSPETSRSQSSREYSANLGPPFICDQCGAEFTAKQSVTRHKRNAHEERRQLSCPLCNKGFVRNDSLLAYARRNHSVKLPHMPRR